VVDDLEGFLQRWRRAAGVRHPGRCALGVKKIGKEKGIWEAAVLPGVQEDEAGLVARSAGSRCPGAPAIPRRSSRSMATRSDRDRLLCFGAQELAKQCQGVALS
jgi:hypothetical protein